MIRSLTLMLLAGAVSQTWTTAATAETVTLRADVWCPFNCEPDAASPGYMIEIAKAALEPAAALQREE